MKKGIAALALLLSMSSVAHAACTTLPPKTWPAGSIRLAAPQENSTYIWWTPVNKCSFGAGQPWGDQSTVFQGLDGYVFDAGAYAGHKATLSFKWTSPPPTGVSLDHLTVEGWESAPCTHNTGVKTSPSFANAGTVAFSIWPGTKGIFVNQFMQQGAWHDMSLTLSSSGVCG